MSYARVIPAVVFSFAVACSGGDDPGLVSDDTEVSEMTAVSAADLPDPCGLVTDDEISELLWQGMEANQRESLQARNAQHSFTKRVEDVEFPAGRTCYVQYQVTAADTVWSEGDFRLRTLARPTFEIFASSSGTQEPIPGVGDQAFYMSNAAYARAGDVGVEVVDFNSKELEIELLRDAVGRLP